jgi:hypothetical protein
MSSTIAKNKLTGKMEHKYKIALTSSNNILESLSNMGDLSETVRSQRYPFINTTEIDSTRKALEFIINNTDFDVVSMINALNSSQVTHYMLRCESHNEEYIDLVYIDYCNNKHTLHIRMTKEELANQSNKNDINEVAKNYCRKHGISKYRLEGNKLVYNMSYPEFITGQKRYTDQYIINLKTGEQAVKRLQRYDANAEVNSLGTQH